MIRLTNLIGKLALLFVSTSVSLLLGEAVVRQVAPQPLFHLRPDIWSSDSGGLGHRLAPDLDTTINTGERDVRLLTDSEGHRIGIGDVPVAGHVLALGDSFLEAMAVPYEHTVTAQLSHSVSERRGIPTYIRNTGVAGYGPAHYRLTAASELSKRPYDAALVFLFLRNDLKKRHRRRFPPRQPLALPVWRLPQALSPAEISAALIYPAYTRLRSRSHLAVLAKQRLLPILATLGLMSDARQAEQILVLGASDLEIVATADVCEEIADFARLQRVPVLFVLIPADFQVNPGLGRGYAASLGLADSDSAALANPNRFFSTELRSRGLHVADALDSLRSAHASGIAVYGKVDRHLSPAGHRVLAELVGPELLRMLDSDP